MATVMVGRNSSYCLDCRKNGLPYSASPSETGHHTVLGYGPDNGSAGCGEEWTVWVQDYFYGDSESMAKEAQWFEKWNPHLAGLCGPYWEALHGASTE